MCRMMYVCMMVTCINSVYVALNTAYAIVLILETDDRVPECLPRLQAAHPFRLQGKQYFHSYYACMYVCMYVCMYICIAHAYIDAYNNNCCFLLLFFCIKDTHVHLKCKVRPMLCRQLCEVTLPLNMRENHEVFALISVFVSI